MNFPYAVFPVQVLDMKDKKGAIAFIQSLPLTPFEQKSLFNGFCKYEGIIMTKEDVDGLLGERRERG
jgi:hypothetical protein